MSKEPDQISLELMDMELNLVGRDFGAGLGCSGTATGAFDRTGL